MQASVTGASSGAQEDAVKAEAKVQDLQGRLRIAEQEKAAAEKAQQVSAVYIGALVHVAGCRCDIQAIGWF